MLLIFNIKCLRDYFKFYIQLSLIIVWVKNDTKWNAKQFKLIKEK